MASQLWFLRHGDAEPHGSRRDAARRLTDRGEAQSAAAGAALRALRVNVAHTFTSPKVRALHTAQIATTTGGITEPVVHKDLVGLDAAEALALAAVGGTREHVLLVGHEPDFSQVVHDLTGARIQLKKGGLVGVRLGRHASRRELIAVFRPQDLLRIGGD